MSPRSVEKVRKFFGERGLDIQVQELPASTRTAQLAAEAIGAPLGSIVKSILFLADGRPVLVLVAGDRKADTRKLASLLGASQVEIAEAETVRRLTGYTIGGVPPVAHPQSLPTLVDESLLRFATIYAAAGSPNALFAIPTSLLVDLVGGRTANLSAF